MQARNEIGDRHVDHACRDDAKEHRFPCFKYLQAEVTAHASEDRGGGREQIHRERLGARIAGVQKDQEVTYFLRNFVRDDGNGGDDAELDALQESGGDQHAVDEVVNGIADDDQRAAAAVVTGGFVAVV